MTSTLLYFFLRKNYDTAEEEPRLFFPGFFRRQAYLDGGDVGFPTVLIRDRLGSDVDFFDLQIGHKTIPGDLRGIDCPADGVASSLEEDLGEAS